MELANEIRVVKQQLNQLNNDKDNNRVEIDQLQLKLTSLLAVYKLQIEAELTKVKLLQTLRTKPTLQ